MSEAGFPGFLFRQKQYQSSSHTTRKALGPVAMGLMISPVKIAGMKEAYRFHFKRDDLPFL